MDRKIYAAKSDAMWSKPYIDKEERLEGKDCLYIHGGFTGTDLKFSYFFPDKDKYEGRFFQYLPPVQGSEDAAIGRTGMEDRIGFALAHGAYYVESNMGCKPFAPLPDPTIVYKASAAAAEYSREVAKRLYGEHRPFGYVYGGSGGSYKTISCVENTDAWDGAAPYVSGTPYSIPYTFTLRTHAKRVLRRVLPDIADHVEPGGISREELYARMNEEEREALEETIRFGFPLRDWFMYKEMDDGSLPIFIQMLQGFDPQYFRDFWEKEGYLGTDKTHSAIKDRICFEAKVKEIFVPGKSEKKNDDLTGVDDAWLRNRVELDGKAWVRIDKNFAKDAYLHGMHVIVKSGASAGYRVMLREAQGDIAVIEPFFGAQDFTEKFGQIREGDILSFDNSDAIALQSYQRHQTPAQGFPAWNVYRNADGTPKYPQREKQYGPRVAYNGCGSLQSGDFGNCKMIVTAALMDESALPWMQDWYRQKVVLARGDDKSHYRLWYIDHALHGDTEKTSDELHLVSYVGALHQALLSLADWVEKGKEPIVSSCYSVREGIVTLPETAGERGGLQAVVNLSVNGEKCIRVKVGEELLFEADISLPESAGKTESVEWSFEGEEDYPVKGTFAETGTNGSVKAAARHVFSKTGTYFAVVRVATNQNAGDVYTRVFNLDRVRVLVSEEKKEC